MTSSFEFPESFLWGAATAGHQVEGHNTNSDWWWHEQHGRLPYKSGAACDHYSRYESDFELARSMGHNAHRMSIEWSRVEPQEGIWDEVALAHYANVIASLRRHGLEPIVTLHHFTNPLWFAERGGWANSDSVRLFARYVEKIAQHVPGVRYWITINEPTVYIKNGYGTGVWPPFRRHGVWESARVLLHLARAHAAAYEILHARLDNVSVGFAHSAPFIAACEHGGWRGKLAARVRDIILNDLFFWLLAFRVRPGSSERRFDFVGINYYTRTIVRAASSGMRLFFGEECRSSHHSDLGKENELGWLVYAPGLYEIAAKFSRYGVPLLITENGLATRDDGDRQTFIREHVAQVARAIRDGLDVRGYMYWTLMDNFEWTHGTTAHFGLAEVDGETQARSPRPSSTVYREICVSNRLDAVEGEPARVLPST